ncbi:hypothetical protein ABPG74_018601 [Tetrahymena malaccensis]
MQEDINLQESSFSLESSYNEPSSWTHKKESFLPKQYKVAQEVEEKILELHNLEIGRDVEIQNIKINLNGIDDDWIHTYISIDKGKDRFKNKEPLVLIHGYGGGSILFQKMFKKLSKQFKVYCIDIIGLNLSSRPNVDHLKTAQEIIDFFVQSIQQWVIQVGLQYKPFYLAGHSFGGYISSFYAKQNQDQVKKLILMSPAGVSKISQQENQDYLNNRYLNMNFKEKLLNWFRKTVWKYQITYEWLYKNCFLPKQYIMKHMITTRLKTKSQKELKLWQQFYGLVLQLPESTSRFVYSLFFYPRVIAHHPVEEIFETDMNIPVHFMYGQHDWMNQEGAQRLMQKNKDLFRIYLIPSSGHHMNVDNPEELSEQIIKILQINEDQKI